MSDIETLQFFSHFPSSQALPCFAFESFCSHCSSASLPCFCLLFDLKEKVYFPLEPFICFYLRCLYLFHRSCQRHIRSVPDNTSIHSPPLVQTLPSKVPWGAALKAETGTLMKTPWIRSWSKGRPKVNYPCHNDVMISLMSSGWLRGVVIRAEVSVYCT